MNWKSIDYKILCENQKKDFSKIRLMNQFIEENYNEAVPKISNYSISEIDLFAKDMGAYIDKVAKLVELKFGTLDRRKKITNVGLSAFHNAIQQGVQFFY